MASVFKPQGAKKYVIMYTDDQGRRRKQVGATDKGVTQRIARDLENKVALRREGLIDPREDAFARHEATPLADHLGDWHRDMAAKGKTTKHADQFRDRAGKLAALAKGTTLDELHLGRNVADQQRAASRLRSALAKLRLSDLTPERIQSALADLRDAGKSSQTTNHYRAALRAFLRWAGDKGRVRDNAMRGVGGYNVAEDLRHVRRSLTDEELTRIFHRWVVG